MADRAPGGTDPTVLADQPTASPSPDAAAVSQAGTGVNTAPTVVAGRYEILGLLGAGGMGHVYRALDRELREVVALKFLHRDLGFSDEMVERFRQEVRLARRVTHRNVARTFDIGEHGSDKFLTMELVDGESLASRLERGALPEGEAVAIAREIVAGMGAAHAVGVVHRDLKPDNVLVESGGRIVITDFGIARVDAPNEATRTAGRMVGTPAYMAPEQLSSTVTVDARADIYAFGAILFEMLTGERAWPGDSPLAVASARLVEPPPDPRKRHPGVSSGLAAIVLRCLARERDARYANAAELDRALASAGPGSAAPRPADSPSVVPPARERSVAVVPFRNFGPPDDAYFVEGLVEDLVDVLATVRGLRVRGRAYGEASDRDVVDTGRRLGVDVVVDGSVRRAGDVLRVSARLVGVEDGFQIWSSRFEQPAGAAFALNDSVARAIASALSASHDAARPQPTDPVAVDLYFRARRALGRFWNLQGLNDAKALFQQALARAPNDPTILSGYVNAQIGRNFFAPLPIDQASDLVRRALTAGPSLPDAWVALGALRFNHGDDPPGAIRALKKALALGPSDSSAHDLAGRILLEADEVADATVHLERALWLDPDQRWARIDLMRSAALSRDWARARELFDGGEGPEWRGHRAFHEARLWSWTGAPKIPRTPLPDDVEVRFRGIAELYLEAAAERDAPPEAPRRSFEEIRRAIEDLVGAALAKRPRARRFMLQQSAEQAAIAGHMEGALSLVAEAVDHGLLDLGWMNRLPMLDPLRGDARFEALRARVAERAARVGAAWRGSDETAEQALASLSAA